MAAIKAAHDMVNDELGTVYLVDESLQKKKWDTTSMVADKTSELFAARAIFGQQGFALAHASCETVGAVRHGVISICQ